MSILNIFNNPSQFRPPPRPENAWFSAGLTTSYPNITTSDDTILSSRLPCIPINSNSNLNSNNPTPQSQPTKPACKIFQVPPNTPSKAVEIDLRSLDDVKDLKDQVMVFQYRGGFFGVDHVRTVLFFLICLIPTFLSFLDLFKKRTTESYLDECFLIDVFLFANA